MLLWCLTLNGADDLRNKPVPALAQQYGSALTYHSVPIDLTDPRAKEELVELDKYGVHGEEYYARRDGMNAPYYKCICASDTPMVARAEVASKLRAVNESLKPYGVELWVYDSLRTVECQRLLWKHFVMVAGKNAGKFCSDPSKFNPEDPRTWPTHATGGALDVTLRRIGTPSDLLFMGTIFDDSSPRAYTRAFESSSRQSESDKDAKRNRRLLYWAMTKQGFANYPYEWWHFDYGTQMWVQNSGGKKKAFYGLPAN